MRHDTNTNEDIGFKETLAKQLPDASWVLDWVEEKFSVEDVFDEKKIKDYVKNTYNPDEVFDDDELEAWAKDHGLVKPEE